MATPRGRLFRQGSRGDAELARCAEFAPEGGVEGVSAEEALVGGDDGAGGGGVFSEEFEAEVPQAGAVRSGKKRAPVWAWPRKSVLRQPTSARSGCSIAHAVAQMRRGAFRTGGRNRGSRAVAT